MKLYLKGDYTKKVPYGYLELAGKMWFPEDEQISYSNVGNNDALQEDFFSNLSLRKGTADKRWSSVPLKEGVRRLFSHIKECIEINFSYVVAVCKKLSDAQDFIEKNKENLNGYLSIRFVELYKA